MFCFQAERRMLRFLDRELPATEWRPLERHMNGCAACRAAFGEWLRLYDQLDRVPRPAVSRRIKRPLVAAGEHKEYRPAHNRQRRLAFAAMACAIAGASWAGFRMGEACSSPRIAAIETSAAVMALDILIVESDF
jgi:anti-sigma factor RsiW